MYVCMGTRVCDDSFLATIYVFTRLYVKPKLVLKIQKGMRISRELLFVALVCLVASVLLI